MRIRYTPLALADLGEVERYVTGRDGAKAAALVLGRIDAALEELTTFPGRGHKGRVAGTRELVVPRTPFIVAYRPARGEVHVLAVIHGARQWPGSF
jgi:toxin ParE1/3/4